MAINFEDEGSKASGIDYEPLLELWKTIGLNDPVQERAAYISAGRVASFDYKPIVTEEESSGII